MEIPASGPALRNRLLIPAVSILCLASSLSAMPISVTASGGPGLYVSTSASTVVDVLAPATIQIGMDFGLDCTPRIPGCPAFNISVAFTGAVLQWSTLSSGGDLLPFLVCGGLNDSSPPIPLICTGHVQPGMYQLSAILNVSTTSLTSVASPSFVTGTVSVISGGPVVTTPEPHAAMLLGIGCMLLGLLSIQRRKLPTAGPGD